MHNVHDMIEENHGGRYTGTLEEVLDVEFGKRNFSPASWRLEYKCEPGRAYLLPLWRILHDLGVSNWTMYTAGVSWQGYRALDIEVTDKRAIYRATLVGDQGVALTADADGQAAFAPKVTQYVCHACTDDATQQCSNMQCQNVMCDGHTYRDAVNAPVCWDCNDAAAVREGVSSKQCVVGGGAFENVCIGE